MEKQMSSVQTTSNPREGSTNSTQNGSPRRILYIEDDADDAFLLPKTFKKLYGERYHFIVEPNGESLLRYLTNGEIVDGIISDYQLCSGEDGLTLLAAVRKIDPTMPVVLFTEENNPNAKKIEEYKIPTMSKGGNLSNTIPHLEKLLDKQISERK